MKAIFVAITLICGTQTAISSPKDSPSLDLSKVPTEPKDKPTDKDLEMQEEFMRQFAQMYSQLPSGDDLGDSKMPIDTPKQDADSAGKTTLLDNQLTPKAGAADQLEQESTDVAKGKSGKSNSDEMGADAIKPVQDNFDMSNQFLSNSMQALQNNFGMPSQFLNEQFDEAASPKLAQKETKGATRTLKDNTEDLQSKPAVTPKKEGPKSDTSEDREMQQPTMMDNYSPPTFKKPLAKSLADARKLEDDDKMEDIEKRLFSIEDKVDHLLMHVGHDLTPHKMTWTPWGMHIMPSYHNPDSMHQKLSMIDHMFGQGGYMGGAGMGHMGYRMGMMGHPMGGYGSMMGMMGYGHKLGLGAANPYGYGLDNVHGGWNMWNNTGLGRRASYPGSSNPYYTGNGSII